MSISATKDSEGVRDDKGATRSAFAFILRDSTTCPFCGIVPASVRPFLLPTTTTNRHAAPSPPNIIANSKEILFNSLLIHSLTEHPVALMRRTERVIQARGAEATTVGGGEDKNKGVNGENGEGGQVSTKINLTETSTSTVSLLDPEKAVGGNEPQQFSPPSATLSLPDDPITSPPRHHVTPGDDPYTSRQQSSASKSNNSLQLQPLLLEHAGLSSRLLSQLNVRPAKLPDSSTTTTQTAAAAENAATNKVVIDHQKVSNVEEDDHNIQKESHSDVSSLSVSSAHRSLKEPLRQPQTVTTSHQSQTGISSHQSQAGMSSHQSQAGISSHQSRQTNLTRTLPQTVVVTSHPTPIVPITVPTADRSLCSSPETTEAGGPSLPKPHAVQNIVDDSISMKSCIVTVNRLVIDLNRSSTPSPAAVDEPAEAKESEKQSSEQSAVDSTGQQPLTATDDCRYPRGTEENSPPPSHRLNNQGQQQEQKPKHWQPLSKRRKQSSNNNNPIIKIEESSSAASPPPPPPPRPTTASSSLVESKIPTSSLRLTPTVAVIGAENPISPSDVQLPSDDGQQNDPASKIDPSTTTADDDQNDDEITFSDALLIPSLTDISCHTDVSSSSPDSTSSIQHRQRGQQQQQQQQKKNRMDGTGDDNDDEELSKIYGSRTSTTTTIKKPSTVCLTNSPAESSSSLGAIRMTMGAIRMFPAPSSPSSLSLKSTTSKSSVSTGEIIGPAAQSCSNRKATTTAADHLSGGDYDNKGRKSLDLSSSFSHLNRPINTNTDGNDKAGGRKRFSYYSTRNIVRHQQQQENVSKLMDVPFVDGPVVGKGSGVRGVGERRNRKRPSSSASSASASASTAKSPYYFSYEDDDVDNNEDGDDDDDDDDFGKTPATTISSNKRSRLASASAPASSASFYFDIQHQQQQQNEDKDDNKNEVNNYVKRIRHLTYAQLNDLLQRRNLDQPRCNHGFTDCTKFPYCSYGAWCPYRHPQCPDESKDCFTTNHPCLFGHQSIKYCGHCDKRSGHLLSYPGNNVLRCPHQKLEVCRNFTKGRCRNGADCRRVHGSCPNGLSCPNIMDGSCHLEHTGVSGALRLAVSGKNGGILGRHLLKVCRECACLLAEPFRSSAPTRRREPAQKPRYRE